jgi:hypothetical protein
MKSPGDFGYFYFCVVVVTLVFSPACAEKTDELKNAVKEGNGITSTGLIFFIVGTGLEYCVIPAALNGDAVIAANLYITGSGLQIAGPILISGGATHVERASNRLGIDSYSANAWGYYKAGLILQLVANVSNLIPWRVVVYDKTDYYYNRVQVTISPIPLIVGLISQIMYIVNISNAYSYIASADKMFLEEGANPPKVMPQFSYSNGKYSAGLLIPF